MSKRNERLPAGHLAVWCYYHSCISGWLKTAGSYLADASELLSKCDSQNKQMLDTAAAYLRTVKGCLDDIDKEHDTRERKLRRYHLELNKKITRDYVEAARRKKKGGHNE